MPHVRTLVSLSDIQLPCAQAVSVTTLVPSQAGTPSIHTRHHTVIVRVSINWNPESVRMGCSVPCGGVGLLLSEAASSNFQKGGEREREKKNTVKRAFAVFWPPREPLSNIALWACSSFLPDTTLRRPIRWVHPPFMFVVYHIIGIIHDARQHYLESRACYLEMAMRIRPHPNGEGVATPSKYFHV